MNRLEEHIGIWGDFRLLPQASLNLEVVGLHLAERGAEVDEQVTRRLRRR